MRVDPRLIVCIAMVQACAPPSQAARRSHPEVVIAFDSATHLPLRYGETPVAYDDVIRMKGELLSTLSDTITIAVHDVLFAPTAGRRPNTLHLASSTGSPTARIIALPSIYAGHHREDRNSVTASAAELLLILRLSILLPGVIGSRR